MLEIDEDSRLGQEVLAGGQRFHAHGVPQEELAAELYERACERLPQTGFAQYEISNFAAAQHRSRHNMKYWRRAPYIGFGLDAHSMLTTTYGAVRFANADVLETYMQPEESESPLRILPREDSLVRVGIAEAFEETVFLGLRMIEGIDSATLQAKYPAELFGPCEEAVQELAGEGLMSNEEGRWRLTLRGRLISNEVFGRLLEGVAA
jgi:oxygen-independent coproporphyrinogen-3 oxidase